MHDTGSIVISKAQIREVLRGQAQKRIQIQDGDFQAIMENWAQVTPLIYWSGFLVRLTILVNPEGRRV